YAGIVGAVETALVVLDERVDAIRVGAGDGDAHLPVDSLRHPAGARDFLPRLAAVGRFEQSAAGAAARHLILDAICLPQRGEHYVRIASIDFDVDAAGLGGA